MNKIFSKKAFSINKIREIGRFNAFIAFGILIINFMLNPSPIHAVEKLHPYFTVKDILPAEMKDIAGIGGIDLLPNGDGVIATWGGSQRSNGELWILPNLASGTPTTPKKILGGLREPLGVKVIGNDFYVMEKARILKFTGSAITWKKDTLWTLPPTSAANGWYKDDQWHHFSFNLVQRDNALWFSTGTAWEYNDMDPLQRGALIRVPLDGSGFTQFARGLRNPDGFSVGVDGEFFATDNQGNFKPVDYLNHIPITNIPTNGRFYGFRTKGNNACGITPVNIAMDNCPSDQEYPPAVWIPYGDLSASPTRLIVLKAGPYAGQMISGDVRVGGILRYFLEKVEGEYQGAVFPMMVPGSGGVDFGIHQFVYTPSGSLLVAGIGGGTCGLDGSGNWNWNSTCRGLDLLTPTDKSAFEILAVHSVSDGFDIELTQAAGVEAGLAANWNVKTTVFTPVQQYGADSSDADNNVNINVTSATLSADAKHVRLKLASLMTRRMYAITMNNVKNTTGGAAYNNVAYYTLNKV